MISRYLTDPARLLSLPGFCVLWYCSLLWYLREYICMTFQEHGDLPRAKKILVETC